MNRKLALACFYKTVLLTNTGVNPVLFNFVLETIPSDVFQAYCLALVKLTSFCLSVLSSFSLFSVFVLLSEQERQH